ncbi:MAG: hypothetical protein AAGF25_02665 [Pseudomonadota bacterium]
MSPAMAWEFKPGAVCVLDHEDENGSIQLTYDPSVPEYSISITPLRPWGGGPIFAMRFEGAGSLTITTDRHSLSEGNTTITVVDRGFGNVLNGLEFNQTATAQLGDQSVSFALNGAAAEVRRFRDCASGVRV